MIWMTGMKKKKIINILHMCNILMSTVGGS
jgi:hypothetical protein